MFPTGNALYSENCGTKVEKDGSYWPYVDKFEGWTRGGSLDQKAVTYGGSDASVRNSGALYEPTESEKSEVSGAPYVYIGKTTAKFEIENINVGTNNNFTFTFTALDQEKYSGTPVFAEINASTIKFAVSVDGGTTYSPVAFTAKKIATGGWYLCTAEFKFPASVSTDKISVRFSDYPFTGSNVDGHQGLRLDDFKLYEGGNGPELGEAPAIEYKKATISQITAAGNYQIDDAVVIANYQRGFLMQDATGIMQVYQYDKELMPTPTVPSVGKKYTIKGVASSYGGLWQIGPTDLILENESTGTVPTPTLVTLDAAGMDALFAAPVIKYVKYTGELTIDGDYYNVNVNGATTIGSISYPNPGVVDANLNGKGVDVEGWFIGATGGKYFTTLGVKVTENSTVVSGEFTTQPTIFTATNPEAQMLNFTANAAAGAVTFELAGTNASMFAYSDVTATSVKVNAIGNNTSGVAYAATLKLKAADGTVLDQVELKQAAESSGNDTKGTYTSMSQFISNGASTANPAGLDDSKANGKDASGFKIGTGSKVGSFTSGAVGVTGTKKLGFYAVAWKGKNGAALTLKVNGGGSASQTSFTLTANDGATGNPPFVNLTPSDDTDYYIVELTDLTAASTITFETTTASNGRAVVFGVQLF